MTKKRRSKGSFGITSPGRGGRGSYARAGEILAPPQMRGKPGISGGTSSRKNNDGDLFTRQSPYKRPRTKSACFIATACAEARGLGGGGDDSDGGSERRPGRSITRRTRRTGRSR